MHGCLKTLKQLLNQIAPDSASDQVFFLGDYVNKGPSSKETLDFMIEYSAQENVFPLLGNHDLLLLEALEQNKIPDFFSEFKDIATSSQEKYINFISSLSYYFILPDHILVHAGMNFNLANPFLGKEEMLNTREFYYDSSKAQNKSIIHGHNPFSIDVIKENIEQKSKVLPLDNGCVYSGEREGMGELLCLELTNHNLYSQTNCE